MRYLLHAIDRLGNLFKNLQKSPHIVVSSADQLFSTLLSLVAGNISCKNGHHLVYLKIPGALLVCTSHVHMGVDSTAEISHLSGWKNPGAQPPCVGP
jgi:hypothetical protein